jgi:predicted nucleic acid-binding protein
MSREASWFIDTNVLVHVLRRSRLGAHLIDALGFRVGPAASMMSVVSQGELLSLATRLRWGPDRRARLEELLNELVIIDVHAAARPLLERYAQLDQVSLSLNQKMGKNDLWSAASAAETDSVLLTTDHDFDHLAPNHLKVWWLDPAAEQWPLTASW